MKFLLEAARQMFADHLVACHEERVFFLVFFSQGWITFIIDVVNAALGAINRFKRDFADEMGVKV